MSVPISDLESWAIRFAAAASVTLAGRGEVMSDGLAAGSDSLLAAGREFSDEAGHRRLVDPPFVAWCRQTPGAALARQGDLPDDAVTRLWWALHDSTIDPDTIISRGVPAPLCTPLLNRPATIEVATEEELCALHALWWLAIRRGRADWRERCVETALWLIEYIQPDNATNHPWGLHVFVACEAELGPEGPHYAATMLHNCQVSLGRPDVLSALILRDAARALRAN